MCDFLLVVNDHFYSTKMSDNTKPRKTRERTNMHADKKKILLMNILIIHV